VAAKIIDTAAAAAELGVSRRRVVQLIGEGRLPAQRVGRDYAILESDLARVRDRKPGRPWPQNSKRRKG
jgi:excisionase family DNA binding protein